MYAKRYITVENGKITQMNISSREVELTINQTPVTESEMRIIQACDGDLEYAKGIIRDLESVIRFRQSRE